MCSSVLGWGLALSEPQIDSLACGPQGHQTSDPNANLQQPQKRGLSGPTQHVHYKKRARSQAEKWHVCKMMQKYFLNFLRWYWCVCAVCVYACSVINSECAWQALSSPAVETRDLNEVCLQCGHEAADEQFDRNLSPALLHTAFTCSHQARPSTSRCALQHKQSLRVTVSTVLPTQGLIWLGKHSSPHPVVTDRCSGIGVFLWPYVNHITGTWWSHTSRTRQPSRPPVRPPPSITYSKWWWTHWVAWKSRYMLWSFFFFFFYLTNNKTKQLFLSTMSYIN